MHIHPKKHLGQHFLIDENIARKIIDAIAPNNIRILEVGPGKGVLTKYLFERKEWNTKVIEIDSESVDFLKIQFPDHEDQIIKDDFLQYSISDLFKKEFSIIGNFPYNISSQIPFFSK